MSVLHNILTLLQCFHYRRFQIPHHPSQQALSRLESIRIDIKNLITDYLALLLSHLTDMNSLSRNVARTDCICLDQNIVSESASGKIYNGTSCSVSPNNDQDLIKYMLRI